MKNIIIMLLVFLLSIMSIPFVMIVLGQFDEDRLAASGIHANPNYHGGVIIAEFPDPENDLLQSLPEAFSFPDYEKALDIRAFSVTKVAFPPFTGQGIASRMNLVFEFDGKLPNPYESHHKFSLPVIHVFMNTSDLSSSPASSEGIPEIAFAKNEWDFQVIIDGMHDQARIYNAEGILIGQSLDIFVHYITDKEEGIVSKTDMPVQDHNVNASRKTRITVALPLSIVGDPAEGQWEYYVVSGLIDLQSPIAMFSRPFDCIQCRTREVDGVLELQPLSTGT